MTRSKLQKYLKPFLEDPSLHRNLQKELELLKKLKLQDLDLDHQRNYLKLLLLIGKLFQKDRGVENQLLMEIYLII